MGKNNNYFFKVHMHFKLDHASAFGDKQNYFFLALKQKPSIITKTVCQDIFAFEQHIDVEYIQ